jgi:eukaryotic-like serine/threonine-protein kinase
MSARSSKIKGAHSERTASSSEDEMDIEELTFPPSPTSFGDSPAPALPITASLEPTTSNDGKEQTPYPTLPQTLEPTPKPSKKPTRSPTFSSDTSDTFEPTHKPTKAPTRTPTTSGDDVDVDVDVDEDSTPKPTKKPTRAPTQSEEDEEDTTSKPTKGESIDHHRFRKFTQDFSDSNFYTILFRPPYFEN